MGQACEWNGHPHDDADDEADDAWEDAPQLRGAVSSLVVCETGVDWDEPDMVWLINMWCTERPELPNWDSAMNKSIFEEQTSELSRFSKKKNYKKTKLDKSESF